MIDLPLGPGGGAPSPPTTKGSPGDFHAPGATPRHGRVMKRPPRRRRWPLWLLTLVVLGGGGYWFFLRPPLAVASVAALGFEPTRVGRESESRAVEITNGGRRSLVVTGVRTSTEEFGVSEDGCTGRALPAAERCTVTVAFMPQAAGPRDGSLIVDSNAAGGAPSIALHGEGRAPELESSPDALDFGRAGVGKPSEAKRLTLVNGGSAPMAIERLALEGSGESSFVWVANGCSGRSLEPKADCSVRIAFQPRTTGSFEATLRVWSDAPEDPRIPVRGTGVAPGLFVDPAELDFGDLRPGQAGPTKSLTVENTGNAPLEIDRVEVTGGSAGAFAVSANDCDGRTLEAEQRCAVSIGYAPREPARHRAALRIRSPSIRQRTEVPLTGALLAARLVLSDTEVDFGQVVQYGTNELEIAVRNTGSAPLRLSRVAIDGGGGAFGIGRHGCGDRLAPGEQCTLGLRFSPSSVGESEGRLSITHDAPGAPAHVRLQGAATALPAPAATVDPRSIDFEQLAVGERSDILTVRVKSTGNALLSLGGYEIRGPQAAEFRVVPASCEGLQSLLPGSDCTIGVRFRPEATGERRATLIVRHGAVGGSTEIALRGQGY